MDPATQVPPLSSLKLVKDVDNQVQKSLVDGARLVCGGKILDESKNLYAPTVLADVTPDMTCYREEIFGPVASVIKAKDIDDAIRLANLNDYALSATVWGDDLEQCKTVARQLEGGMIFVNAPAGSKASLPFGGVKKSGYGKENGPDGIKAFTNRKVVLY
jgi:succinate-semialdehyde dehydrogenase/glutarate-semialdehyde dehydrogenase